MADNTSNIGTEVLDLLRASPQTASTVNSIPISTQPPPPGVERYAREGVPLDTTTGATWLSRARASVYSTPEGRQEAISRAYGGATVVPTDEGNLIIRNVLDEQTGKPIDLLVDEQRFNLSGDLSDLAAPALRTAAELMLLKRAGFNDMKAMARLLGGTPAAASFGELTSMTAQALMDQKETFGEHLKQFGFNTAAGIGLGTVAEAVPGVYNLLRGAGGELATGPAERAGIAATKAINAEAGTTLTPSIAQMAQSPDVINLQTFLHRLPFFGKRIIAQEEAQAEQMRALQRYVFDESGPPLQPLAELGADLAEVARGTVAKPLAQMSAAEANIASRAADQLESAITSIAPAARSLTEEPVSNITKLATKGQFGQFRQVRDQLFAEAGNPDIPTAPLKPLLQAIKDELPKKNVITESDLVNEAGKPLVTTAGRQIDKTFVPSELMKFINGLEGLDAQMPLGEIRRIRNIVDDAIVEGKGLEGVGTRDLKQLQHAITETINRGAAELGEQGAAVLRANRFYAENINRFESPLVARLLKDQPQDPGYIGNFELIKTIRNDPDKFRQLEEFLKGTVTEGGKALAPAREGVFNLIRRNLLEDILSRSRVNPASSASRIDAHAFARELEQYPPAIRSTLLGASEDVVNRNLDLLKQLKEGFKDVPADKLDSFLRFPANEVEDLSRLATASKEVKGLMENEVIGNLLKGDPNVDIERLGSEEALDWLWKAKKNSDVAEILAYASGRPEIQESIRRNSAVRLFQEVAQSTKPSDAARLNDLTQLVDPAKLIQKFRDPASRSRLRLLLGQDSFNFLENFATTMSLFGKTGQGSLSTGTTATGILTRTYHFFKNVPLATKFAIYSAALTNPSLQKAVMEGSLNAATDLPRFTLALVSSPPVLRALQEQFGQRGAELAVQNVKKEVQRSQTNQPAAGGQNVGEDVLQLLQRR